MKIVQRTGMFCFYLAWPLFYLYLRRSERTRIVVIWEGRVLALKNWISDGRWSLPGGGVHSNEDPKQGALRELFEETGIRMTFDDLEEIGKGRYRSHGLSYPFRSYVVYLTAEASLRRQRIEVSEIAWMLPNELLLGHTSPDVLMSLAMLTGRHPEFLIQ